MSSAPPSRSLPIVRTFMTHEMGDVDIAALSTGRDDEFKRLMGAIKRSLEASPGSLQHAVLYGSRGFGKSFMTRRVQIGAADLPPKTGRVLYLLLPEEQHNLQRSPHAFLDAIRHTLVSLEKLGDDGFEESHFQWPQRGQDEKLWREAAAGLETAIDEALGTAKGLVVAVVENFDTLLATLFDSDEAEQRLRLWLDKPKNRLMLLATATGTVDINYDRPLFKAFEPVRLSPWSGDDCIAYFNKLRDREGKPHLTSAQEAKGRAIADFIGGTPRLAQLLAEVIDTQDALTVAETMSALADKLAEYYRRRIEDLPPLARGLLDALIRGGEPASQTQLARRVGARGQSDIARVMSDLQRADIIRGRQSPDSREKLYSVTDRVFVHYYRLRQGSKAARGTPLATILDFLRSFYTPDEQRQQCLKHLVAGRPAEATIFSSLALEGTPPQTAAYVTQYVFRLKCYINPPDHAIWSDLPAVERDLAARPAEVYESVRCLSLSDGLDAAVALSIKCQAMARLGNSNDVIPMLEEALGSAAGNARFVLLAELAWAKAQISGDRADAEAVAAEAASMGEVSPRLLAAVAPFFMMISMREKDFPALSEWASRGVCVAAEVGDVRNERAFLSGLTYSLVALGEREKMLPHSERMIELSRLLEDQIGEARGHFTRGGALLGLDAQGAEIAFTEALSLGRSAGDRSVIAQALAALCDLHWRADQYEKTVDFGNQYLALEESERTTTSTLTVLQDVSYSLGELERFPEAIENSKRAATLADQLNELSQKVIALRHLTSWLNRISDHEQAIETGKAAAELAAQIGDKGEEAEAIRWTVYSLTELERYREAWERAVAGVQVASEVDDRFTLSQILLLMVEIGEQLPQPEAVQAYERWVSAWEPSMPAKEMADPRPWLDVALIAAARADALVDFDSLISVHSDKLLQPNGPKHWWGRAGDAIVAIANEEGRAAAYTLAQATLPRVHLLSAKTGSQDSEFDWAQSVALQLAENASDAGVLRDISMLLGTMGLSTDNEARSLLDAVAGYLDARQPEAFLARIDPDLGTLIRRIRKLAEDGPAQRPSSKRKRK